MQQITIPDTLYTEAARIAQANGVSMEQFVAEALQLHIEDTYDGPAVTPELIASLRAAEAEIDSGNGLTTSQVEQNLAKKRAAWIQAHPR